VELAAAEFPGDIGVVLSLLLNYVELGPGEAIYLGAGNVHAYLQGTGVEIMANSDNVLRCGLTPKHIDVDELLHITDFGEVDDPRWPRGPFGYTVPVPDFRLMAFDDGSEVDYVIPRGRPSIVLSTAGDPTVNGLTLTPGHAAFVSAATQASVTGYGTVFVATVGALS
jgi:mannose-6-phosphate isomerase